MGRRWSMFHRLFLSYIVVTLIPVSAFFAILYENSVVKTRHELEMFNTSNLYQIRDNLDLRIQEFKNIATQISYNPKLSYYNMVLDNYKVLEGIEELSKYKAGNAFANDVLLFYRRASGLYTSRGTSSVEAYLSRNYGFTKEENEQFYERLQNVDTPALEVFRASDIVMYMVPLPVIGGYHNSVAMFTFQGRSLRKKIVEGNTDHIGSTFILDAGKNIILTTDNAGPEDHDWLEAYKEEIQPGISTIEHQNKLYSLITTVSEETGWHYVTALPKKEFFEQVTAREIWIILGAVVGLLCCIATALMLALSNYQPIRKLNRFINDNLPPTEGKGSTNELDNISSAVNHAIVLNRKLKTELDSHQHLYKQSLLIRLLKGEAGDWNEFVVLMESCGLNLNGPHYTVLAVSCEDHEAMPSSNQSLLDFVSEYAGKGLAYAVEFGEDNSLVMIANIDAANGRSELSGLAEAVVEFIGDVYGTRGIVGIGKSYDALWGVNHSYIEACAAKESKKYKTQVNIVYFEDITSYTQSFWQTSEEEIYWVHGLKHGDSQLARKALDGLFAKMEDGRMPASVSRYVCFKLMDAAVQVMNDYSANSQMLLSADNVSEMLIKAVNYTSQSDYKQQMYGLIEVICDHVGNVIDRREVSLITHLKSFMEENYKDPSISLETISQKFGYSIYYWSRFFKEKIGCHFSDYLWNLRVKEAKRQFAASSKTLKEIVLELGYSDLTSFTRKFKTEEGITPGQYRKLYASGVPFT